MILLLLLCIYIFGSFVKYYINTEERGLYIFLLLRASNHINQEHLYHRSSGRENSSLLQIGPTVTITHHG